MYCLYRWTVNWGKFAMLYSTRHSHRHCSSDIYLPPSNESPSTQILSNLLFFTYRYVCILPDLNQFMYFRFSPCIDMHTYIKDISAETNFRNWLNSMLDVDSWHSQKLNHFVSHAPHRSPHPIRIINCLDGRETWNLLHYIVILVFKLQYSLKAFYIFTWFRHLETWNRFITMKLSTHKFVLIYNVPKSRRTCIKCAKIILLD